MILKRSDYLQFRYHRTYSRHTHFVSLNCTYLTCVFAPRLSLKVVSGRIASAIYELLARCSFPVKVVSRKIAIAYRSVGPCIWLQTSWKI